MDKMTIKIRLVDPRAIAPTQRDGDAGADVYAISDMQVGRVPVRVPLGIAIEVPYGHVANVVGRSGLSSRGVIVAPGTIDPGYRGEISAIMYSLDRPHNVRRGDRVAQLVIWQCPRVEYEPCASLPDTGRGANGFGSTGYGESYRTHGNSG